MPDLSPIDARCLVTTESLVIDGANAVCRFPRVGSHREAAVGVAWHLVIALALVLVIAVGRRALRRWLGSVLVIAIAASAVPGTYALLAVRADAPWRQAQTAREIGALLEAMDGFVTRHRGCVVLRSECPACRPIGLFVAGARLWDWHPPDAVATVPFPGDRACSSRDARIALGADGLERPCQRTDSALICGSSGGDAANDRPPAERK
jgi:hypothetical protein